MILKNRFKYLNVKILLLVFFVWLRIFFCSVGEIFGGVIIFLILDDKSFRF